MPHGTDWDGLWQLINALPDPRLGSETTAGVGSTEVISIASSSDDGGRTLTQELEALLEEEWGGPQPPQPPQPSQLQAAFAGAVAPDCGFDDENAECISERADSTHGQDEAAGFMSKSEL